MKKLLLLSLLSISLFSCSNEDESKDANTIWDEYLYFSWFYIKFDYNYESGFYIYFLEDKNELEAEIVRKHYSNHHTYKSEYFQYSKKILSDSTLQITFYDNKHSVPFVGVINKKSSQMVYDGDSDITLSIDTDSILVKKGTIFSKNH